MVKIKAKCIQPHKTLQQLELYLKNLVALLSLSLTNIILTFLVISKHKGISKAIRCFILSLKNDIALQITHTLLEQLPLKLVQMPPEGRISHKWTEGTKLCKAESSWASLAPNLYQSPWPGSILWAPGTWTNSFCSATDPSAWGAAGSSAAGWWCRRSRGTSAAMRGAWAQTQGWM